MRAGPWPKADTPALQERGLARRPSGQKGLLDLNQRTEDPWRDLFLWAVLQNRHEMATYFWAMVWMPTHLPDTRQLSPVTPACSSA